MSNKEHEAQSDMEQSIEQQNHQATSEAEVLKDSAADVSEIHVVSKTPKIPETPEESKIADTSETNEESKVSLEKPEESNTPAPSEVSESLSDTPDTPETPKADGTQDTVDPSMDNEVSKITGRPQLTEEDNEKFRSGPRFFHKAMEARARALGEDYSPYRIPPEMRAALAQIDHEAAIEKAREKAAAQGKDVSSLKDSDLELETSAIEQLHAVSPDEQEKLRKVNEEKQKIESGGARFYGNYQKMIERHSGQGAEHELSTKAKILRNLKIAVIVLIALAGFIGYNEFFVDKDAQSISELKSMLPYPVDAHTTMVRIDDRNDEFKIFFERIPEAYEGMDEAQKEASLNLMEQNAPMLCNNALLHSIITSGKKVTVLLDATDGSFHREFTVESCPVK